MDETKYGFWLPVDVSSHGAQIDNLMAVVHWFMLLLFVGWGIFFVYCLVKFRARPGHVATYNPVKAVFTKYIEAAVVVVEVFLLFGLSTPVWFKYKGRPASEKDAVVVQLVAEQFAWNFHYAGKDGKFGKSSTATMSGDNPLGLDPDDPAGKDDITTVNQFRTRSPAPASRSGSTPRSPATSSSPARSCAASAITGCAPTSSSTRPRTTPSGRRRTLRPPPRNSLRPRSSRRSSPRTPQ
ncbi:MAG: hypothetical protein E6J62_17535 [Deltaproteobacteria bacterium]|nr:MAG: hypothetical protein E6J62_17535 [Deltaproteobacteria bacterium]